MSPVNGSSIVAVDQAKKKVIGFIWEAPLAIADARVPVDLMVIDASRVALLVDTRVPISSVQFSFRLNWYWTNFLVIGSVNLPKFQF